MTLSRQVKWAAAMAGLATGVVLTNALILERLFFTVKNFYIGHVAGGKQPLRIVHLTDLHIRQSLTVFHKRLAKKLNRLHPDLILITGDSIDQAGHPEPFEVFMRLLDSQIPKYGIMGNHEYKAGVDAETMARIFSIAGGHLMVDETRAVTIRGTKLVLTGLDDIVKSTSDFERAVEGVGPEDNHLVLLHSPGHYDEMLETLEEINAKREPENHLTIYCALAGHTHGGQVTLTGEPLVLPDKSKDYNRGWYGSASPFLYVSKGFGVSGLPVRMRARSEITLLHYHPF